MSSYQAKTRFRGPQIRVHEVESICVFEIAARRGKARPHRSFQAPITQGTRYSGSLSESSSQRRSEALSAEFAISAVPACA